MRRKRARLLCQLETLEIRQLLSTIYVDAIAPGPTHDGSSWTNAYTDLQQALTIATTGTTIEVAQGTYKPTTGTDRAATFQLKDDVAIQGGYAGYGQTNPDARDVSAYPSVLSGDIGTVGNNSDNSYHVVTANAVDNTAILDGFTITGGNANNTANVSTRIGGGIYDSNGSPSIADCTITGNSAENGAGMTNVDASPILTDCILTGNAATHGGGGLYDKTSSSVTLVNCIIAGNTAGTYGGAIRSNGGSSANLTSCTITDNNAANQGGALFGQTSSTLSNCILWDDTAASASSEIVGGATVTYSDVQGGFTGAGNVNADPLFVRNPSANRLRACM